MSDQALLQLLDKRLDSPESYDDIWTKLTSGDRLYRLLRSAAAQDGIEELQDLIADWRSYAEYNSVLDQWLAAERMIRCAILASRLSNDPASDHQPGEDSGSERILTNLFREFKLRSVTTPIVRIDRPRVHTLELTLISSGHGDLIRHPADTFAKEPDSDFQTSMADAWEAARRTMSDGADVSGYDGCWRVLDEDGVTACELNGNSAGGAAATAWTRILRSQKIDTRLIVMASTDPQGRFAGVDGISAKIRAAAERNDIDTIITSDENREEAEQALKDAVSAARIDLQVAPSLHDALKIRSKLSSEVIEYCERLIKDLDDTPWSGPTQDRIKISEIAVPVRIRADLGMNEDADGDDEAAGLRKPDAVEGATSLAMRSHRWSYIFPPPEGGLVVLKARPGFGKTAHTKYEAIKAAERLRDRLGKWEATVDEVSSDSVVPIWLPFIKLVASKQGGATEKIIDAVATRLRLKMSAGFRQHLSERLPTNALLFFDGFDELTSTAGIKDAFREMREWISPRCVTCREGNYSLADLSPTQIPEYTLAPFEGNWLAPIEKDRSPIASFIRNWFSKSPVQGDALLRSLKRNYALQDHCRSPLMLTFACITHQEHGVNEQTTSAHLFENAISKLLQSDWRTDADFQDIGRQAYPTGNFDSQIYRFGKLLTEISYTLLRTDPRPNRFTYTTILKAMDAAAVPCRPAQPMSAIDWLKEKGILEDAGFEGLEAHLSFAHRDLLGYLAAKHLQDVDEWIDIVTAGITDADQEKASAWCDIVQRLVGQLDDATPVIRQLIDLAGDDERADYRQLYLATLLGCLFECKAPPGDDLRDRAFEALLIGLDVGQTTLRGHQWQRLNDRDGLARILAAAEKSYKVPKERIASISEILDLAIVRGGSFTKEERGRVGDLLHSLTGKVVVTPPERWCLVWAGACVKKNAAKYLAAFLQDSNSAVRAIAARAVARVQAGKAFDNLTGRLTVETHQYVLANLIGSLGQLGDKRALSFIRPYILSDSATGSGLRGPAMFALAKFPDPGLTDIFRAGLDDPDEGIQTSAITGLAGLGDIADVATIIDKLKNGSPKVRRSAAWALRKFQKGDAIPSLITATQDTDEAVAMMAWRSLSAFALEIAEGEIRELIQKATATQKITLAQSWKVAADRELERPRDGKLLVAAAKLCLDLLADDDSQVCHAASRAWKSLTRIEWVRSSPLPLELAKPAWQLLLDKSDHRKAIGFNLFIQLLRTQFGRRSPYLEKAVYVSLRVLAHSTVQQAKLAAYAFLIELARKRVPIVLQNKRLVEQILAASETYLGSGSTELRRNAIKAFEELLPLIDGNRPAGFKSLTMACLAMLDDRSSIVRKEAVAILSTIVAKIDISDRDLASRFNDAVIKLLHHHTADSNEAGFFLLAKTLEPKTYPSFAAVHNEVVLSQFIASLRSTLSDKMLADESPTVVRNALRSAGFLIRHTGLKGDSDALEWFAYRCVALINDYQPVTLKVYALATLQNVHNTGILTDPGFQRKSVESCLNVISELQQDRPETDTSSIAAQITAVILVNQLLIGALREDNQLIHEALDVCLPLVNSKDATLASAALQTCDIVTRTAVSHDTVIEYVVKRTLDQVDHPDQKVRSAAIGVLIACAYSIRGDDALTSKLFQRSVKFLRDQGDPDVKKSALILLDRLFAASFLSHDKEKCTTVVDLCLRMVDTERGSAVREAALRTLETVIVQPALADEHAIAGAVAEKAFELFTKEGPTQNAAGGLLGRMAARNISALLDNEDLLASVVSNSLDAMEDTDTLLVPTACYLLDAILQQRRDFFVSRSPVMRRIFTASFAILRESGNDKVLARTNRLLSHVLGPSEERLSSELVDDRDLSHQLWKDGNDLLRHWGELPEHAPENVLRVLEKLDLWKKDKAEVAFITEFLPNLSEIMESSQASQASINAGNLLSEIVLRKSYVIGDPRLMERIALHHASLLANEDPSRKNRGAFQLARLIVIEPNVLDDERLLAVANECIRGLEHENNFLVNSVTHLLCQILELRSVFFSGQRPILEQILNRSLKLLRVCEDSALLAHGARLFKKAFQLLKDDPADSYRETIAQDAVMIGLRMMSEQGPEPAFLQGKGCKLLSRLIKCGITLRPKLADEARMQIASLLESHNSTVRTEAESLRLLIGEVQSRSNERFEASF